MGEWNLCVWVGCYVGISCWEDVASGDEGCAGHSERTGSCWTGMVDFTWFPFFFFWIYFTLWVISNSAMLYYFRGRRAWFIFSGSTVIGMLLKMYPFFWSYFIILFIHVMTDSLYMKFIWSCISRTGAYRLVFALMFFYEVNLLSSLLEQSIQC